MTYLFRGKNKNGQWIYGSLLSNYPEKSSDSILNQDSEKIEQINPQTVGIQDPISKKFEGDTCEYGPYHGIVKFGQFHINKKIKASGFYIEWIGSAASALRQDLLFWSADNQTKWLTK